MIIVRYSESTGLTRVGALDDNGLHPVAVPDLAAALQLPVTELRALVESALQGPLVHEAYELLPPVDGRTEVWAAGVTYEVSQSARVEESERSATVYEQVYDADRPELFFKSVAWRVTGEGGIVRARADSAIDVPEPELALLVNRHQEVVGYAVCDDVSSRSIEAENPLYLPQAKVYTGCCALGPGIRPVWELPSADDLALSMIIERDGERVFDAATSTALLHRTLPDLVDWLHRELDFPDGVWLSTGTCLVPDLPFSLADGDTVIIEIAEVGRLTSTVSRT